MASGHDYPPVAGVSFAIYCGVLAEASLQQMRSAQLPMEHTEQRDINPYSSVAGARGIDPPTWMRAQLVWGCRAILDPELGVEQGREIGKVLSPGMPDMSAFMPKMSLPQPPQVDPSDPRLAPIEGITIETYVRLIGTQMLYPALPEDQLRDVAVQQLGFPPDRWQAVSEAWGTRVTGGPPVSVRYAQLICQLLG
jgi:hypothetical protein